MKRSADLPPQCALNPQDVTGNNSHPHQARDDRNYLPNRAPGRNSFQGYPPGQTKREPQCMSQPWPTPTYDNSNTSWEGGDWSGTPPIKTDLGANFYKQQPPRSHPATNYPSGSEWSPGESSASSSVASSYGMVQSPSSSSIGGSYYENNGYYSSGYNNYGQQGGYPQPNYAPQQPYQQQQQPPSRPVDGYHHLHNNRTPSNCPPVVKQQPQQPMLDFHRRQVRYGMEGIPKVQIKQEPEEYPEMEGENFTSLFTKSLTSLYSQDTENAFSEENNDPDIMILSPLPPPPPPPPQPIQQLENQVAYQRLHSSGGHYTTGVPGEYQDSQNNFGFYENKILNCEPNVVQEIGAKGDGMNSFRYDRPSFDDMHLYAPNSADSKSQLKKRKNSMPNAPPENFTDNRKKASRMRNFKSESQWTPNSFGFDGIQIKQEPIDDYNSNDLETAMSFQDSSPGSSGNGNSKPSEQPKEHPKQPPRKRSPATTCFDRFDKKSTPSNKKVSPLSVYAKVQDSMVLSVKCRRYKKRTKPITCKEEAASPGKEEMENYKRLSLTPDQAARHVMNDLLDRVSLFGDRNVIGCSDLSQMEPYKLRDLFMQFCHRSNLDYRDFEDIKSILTPRIVEDKAAKNSVRASAIRKRTRTSPVEATTAEPPPANQAKEPQKTRRRRKAAANSEDLCQPFEKRVLRQLPGRAARNNGSPVIVARRYSTRNNSKEESKDSDADIVIDLSTDREDEAGKEAEVRKKSQRLKNKRSPIKKAVAVRDRSLEENEEPVTRATTSRGRSRLGRKPAREKSLDKAKVTGKAREESLDKAKATSKAREESLDKVKPTGKTRVQSLANVSKPNNVEHFEDTRRRTRSREKKVEVPMEICRPPPRKKRSCQRRMISNDSLWEPAVEIVDITRSSDSASPPLLDAIKIEPSPSTSVAKIKNKIAKRGRSDKDDVNKALSSALIIPETIKAENIAEVDPPVLRRSVKRKRTGDAAKMEPPSLEKPTETTKRRNSIRMEPPSLPVSVEKIKTKAEIKKEPLSPTANDQKIKFDKFNGAVGAEAADYNLASSMTIKDLKPKFEEIPKLTAARSGSSKRKQGGPTKFLKDSFKSATFSTYLDSNNLASDAEQSNSKIHNSNLLSKFSSSKLFNNITAAGFPEPVNSSESLKERYRKSFCTEPLRNASLKRPKDEKPMKFSPFLKSNNPMKHLKESLAKAPVLKSEEKNNILRSQSFSNLPNISSSFMVKVKEEPLSEDDTPSTSNNSQIIRPSFSKIKAERKQIKRLPRRHNSQCSDSELQVVLTKLPDVQVNLRNGSVADELVKKCEEEQDRMDAGAKERELSDYDSDEEKPLMALKNRGWKREKKGSFSACKSIKEPYQHGNLSSSITLKNSTSKVIKPENLKTKRRLSDSEDSDCGLVIDLDRRLSVEERVPSRIIESSNTDEDMTETEDMDFAKPEDKPQTIATSKPPVSKSSNKPDQPTPKVKDEPILSVSAETKHSSLFRDATEEAHILLELSRGGMPALVEEVSGPLNKKWKSGMSGGNDQVKVEMEQAKEPERDESILRTLLLENGDAAPSTSQDVEPSTSSESKHVPKHESMRLPSYPEFQANSSSLEIDEKKMMDELQQNSDQMSSDVNANFLPASYEWCLRDPQAIREVIQKLQDEIRYLQCMADERSRESTSIVCFKRYKEEILKRLLKKYTANMNSEWGEQKNPTTNRLNGHQPVALTSSSNGIHPRLSSALTGGATVKSEMPSATVTSGESYTSNSGENLPPVATMVANATENYGVDLRTVTSRRGAGSSSKTILQEALSSKELIYRPVATRSPLPPNERPPDSIKVVQNSPLAGRESGFQRTSSSPMLPELSRTSHLSRRLLSMSSSSQSPPSLQPELRHSSFSPVGGFRQKRPMSFGVAFEEPKATKTRHVSPSPSRRVANSKCSPRSSPKSNSLSMWGKLEAERNSSPSFTSFDLRMNQGSPDFSRSKTVDPRANHNRSASVDPRAIHLSSNGSVDPRANHMSPHRPTSNRASSVDLRANHMSPSRSNPVGLTNGHSSFMIVPPPTTLQSAFKEKSHHRSRSEIRSSDKDKEMNGQIERIYEHRNEEEPHPRFVPLAGPLTPIAPSSDFPKCSGCGISRGRYVCSGCERQLYCSAKCQSLRWAEHSKTCSSTHRKENSKSCN